MTEKNLLRALFLCECLETHSPTARLLIITTVGAFGLLVWSGVICIIQKLIGLNTDWYTWRVSAVCFFVFAAMMIATILFERAASKMIHQPENNRPLD